MKDLAIDETTRQMISSKIDEFKGNMEKSIKDREEALNKKIDEMKKAKAKK